MKKVRIRDTRLIGAAAALILVGSSTVLTSGPASAKTCDLDFVAQSFTNCKSTARTELITYVSQPDPGGSINYYTKNFCVGAGKTRSVLIPGGFWIAETALDKGKC